MTIEGVESEKSSVLTEIHKMPDIIGIGNDEELKPKLVGNHSIEPFAGTIMTRNE